MSAVHLWEAPHSYYCNQGNYFDNNCHDHHKRFSDFLDEYRDCDFDYNLIFRWDWEEKDDDGDSNYNGDDNYRNGKLLIFWMGQRKGLYRYTTVDVCRADEPAVIEFLKPRMEHLFSLWAPLHTGAAA